MVLNLYAGPQTRINHRIQPSPPNEFGTPALEGSDLLTQLNGRNVATIPPTQGHFTMVSYFLLPILHGISFGQVDIERLLWLSHEG